MRLDKRLLALLLAKLEAVPLPYGTTYVLSHEDAEVQVDGYDLDTIGYHLDKLRDMGLIDLPGSQPMIGVTFAGLSVEGHEYLERAREDLADAGSRHEALPATALDEIRAVIEEIRAELRTLTIRNADKSEIEADIGQTEIEIERPAPRRPILKVLLLGLRDNLIRVGLTKLVEVAVSLIDKFL